jgi:hypothetical protein
MLQAVHSSSFGTLACRFADSFLSSVKEPTMLFTFQTFADFNCRAELKFEPKCLKSFWLQRNYF